MELIFTADDLGVCSGTNEGIDRACEGGLLGAASVAVTGEAAEEGVRVARRRGLAVGLHFALTLGRALTGPLPGLTDRGGAFLSPGAVLAACCAGRVSRDAVRAELLAQLDRAAQLGVHVAHLDGHHHVHTFPVVRAAVIDVLAARPVAYVRVPIDRGAGLRRAGRRALVALLARGLAREAERRLVSLPSRAFVGMALYDARDHRRRFERTLAGLSPCAYEWMVHPRVEDERFARLNHLDPRALAHAPRELEVLSDPRTREAVERAGRIVVSPSVPSSRVAS